MELEKRSEGSDGLLLQKQENGAINHDVNHPEPPRETWKNKVEFILACIGYAVGLGNMWRFPYLCYKSGGGAFLIPYVIMLFLCGIPMLFMELAVGQYTRRGPIGAMAKLCPALKGAGVATVVISFLLATYYNVIIAWVMYYLVSSFSNELPWSSCQNNTWSTDRCWDYSEGKTPPNNSVPSTQEFFDRNVLEVTTGIEDMGSMRWDLFGYLCLAWILVYFCLWKGIKTSGAGVATVVISFLLATYYNVIIAWVMYYLVSSFSNELSWSSCQNNTWSTDRCWDYSEGKTPPNNSVPSIQDFFDHNVLEVTTGIGDMGSMRWDLFGYLCLAWILVYFCLWKGIKSSGKFWFIPSFLILLAEQNWQQQSQQSSAQSSSNLLEQRQGPNTVAQQSASVGQAPQRQQQIPTIEEQQAIQYYISKLSPEQFKQLNTSVLQRLDDTTRKQLQEMQQHAKSLFIQRILLQDPGFKAKMHVIIQQMQQQKTPQASTSEVSQGDGKPIGPQPTVAQIRQPGSAGQVPLARIVHGQIVLPPGTNLTEQQKQALIQQQLQIQQQQAAARAGAQGQQFQGLQAQNQGNAQNQGQQQQNAAPVSTQIPATGAPIAIFAAVKLNQGEMQVSEAQADKIEVHKVQRMSIPQQILRQVVNNQENQVIRVSLPQQQQQPSVVQQKVVQQVQLPLNTHQNVTQQHVQIQQQQVQNQQQLVQNQPQQLQNQQQQVQNQQQQAQNQQKQAQNQQQQAQNQQQQVLAQQSAMQQQIAVDPNGNPLVNPKTKTALATLLTSRLQTTQVVSPSPPLPQLSPTIQSSLPDQRAPSVQATFLTKPSNQPMTPQQQEQYMNQQLQKRQQAAAQLMSQQSVLSKTPVAVASVQPPGTQQSKGTAFTVSRISTQFYGHEPTVKLPGDLCLLGCVFIITDYHKSKPQETVSEWKKVINRYGGEIESTYGPRITHVLCCHLTNPFVQQAIRDNKRCVTAFWLNDVVIKQQLFPPTTALHLPLPFSDDNRPCHKMTMSVSAFEGDDRIKVKAMIEQLGAKYTGYFSKNTSILVCK
ncbi:hypothetical protein QYM36_017741, partial [Artemia franciscana]